MAKENFNNPYEIRYCKSDLENFYKNNKNLENFIGRYEQIQLNKKLFGPNEDHFYDINRFSAISCAEWCNAYWAKCILNNAKTIEDKESIAREMITEVDTDNIKILTLKSLEKYYPDIIKRHEKEIHFLEELDIWYTSYRITGNETYFLNCIDRAEKQALLKFDKSLKLTYKTICCLSNIYPDESGNLYSMRPCVKNTKLRLISDDINHNIEIYMKDMIEHNTWIGKNRWKYKSFLDHETRTKFIVYMTEEIQKQESIYLGSLYK